MTSPKPGSPLESPKIGSPKLGSPKLESSKLGSPITENPPASPQLDDVDVESNRTGGSLPRMPGTFDVNGLKSDEGLYIELTESMNHRQEAEGDAETEEEANGETEEEANGDAENTKMFRWKEGWTGRRRRIPWTKCKKSVRWKTHLQLRLPELLQ